MTPNALVPIPARSFPAGGPEAWQPPSSHFLNSGRVLHVDDAINAIGVTFGGGRQVRVTTVRKPKAVHALFAGRIETYFFWRVWFGNIVKLNSRTIVAAFPGRALMIRNHEIADDLHFVRVNARRLGDLIDDARTARVFDVQDRHGHALHMRDVKKIAFLVDPAAVTMARQITMAQQTHVPAFSSRRDFGDIRTYVRHAILLLVLLCLAWKRSESSELSLGAQPFCCVHQFKYLSRTSLVDPK